MNRRLVINNRIVDSLSSSYLIAEVGLAHDGSLGAAHAFVDAAAKTGVDAIKFQTHITEEESSPFEQFRVNVFPQDATRPDYWERTSFTKDQWLKLADYTRSQGLDFLSSPFSNLAVDWLKECHVSRLEDCIRRSYQLPNAPKNGGNRPADSAFQRHEQLGRTGSDR